MNKIHIKDDLIAYLENTLPPVKQSKVESHLSVCQSCRELLYKFSRVYTSYDSIVCPDPNPFLYTRVISRLAKEQQPVFGLPVSIIQSLKPMATGLFCLTAITFSIFLGNNIFSGNHSKADSKVDVSEMSYEYFLNNNEDPMVDLIINNEK